MFYVTFQTVSPFVAKGKIRALDRAGSKKGKPFSEGLGTDGGLTLLCRKAVSVDAGVAQGISFMTTL